MTFAPLLLALLLEVREAEVRWALPPALLVAVVLHESSGRQRLITRERGGHCSVGAGQVMVRGCHRERVQRLLVLSVNLDAAARVLDRSRRLCEAHRRWSACRRSRWALYNAGSATWWGGVARIWRRLLWRRGGES